MAANFGCKDKALTDFLRKEKEDKEKKYQKYELINSKYKAFQTSKVHSILVFAIQYTFSTPHRKKKP